ncbi:MAG: histidine phosphatase family protein [Variibacter sp.]|nr:histidine phosphatase family protein [Variibacter sp.]
MRRLMLMRHAKAEPAVHGQRDIDRPLAPRGRDVAPLIGRYLAEHGLAPDRVLISSARRTRETFEALAPALPRAPAFKHEPRLYEASPKTMLAVLQEEPSDAHTILLVGHNPGVQELSVLLTGAGDSEARHRVQEKFPTAAVAVLDFATDTWRDLKPSSGRLDRFVTPRLVHAEAD